MNIHKMADRHFWQYMRALRHELSRASFSCAISENDIAADDRLPSGDAVMPFVVFTAADTPYLLKFGPSFVGSLVKHVPSPRLHVHLYNPASSALALLNALKAAYPDLHLTWSTEDFDQKRFEEKRAKAGPRGWLGLYICCARFLAARAVQRRLDVSLLILDVDVIFNADVTRRFTRDVEYALMRRPKQRSLAKRTLGGAIYVSSSPRGRLFLDRICIHIERFLGGGSHWRAFDQYAVYRAFRYMQSHTKLKGFSELTARDVSLDLAPDAMILYPKGKTKHGDKFSLRLGEFTS